MSTASWKPVRTFAWDGLCCAACGDAHMAAVTLVDSGASHCFVSEALAAKFALLMLPGDGMEVTLADGSQVEASRIYLVPLVVCSAH